jgi:hypothetical protein
MNDTIKLEDGVADFVDQVRARLADLTADERAELTDGLEADLGDLVAERGPDALGDPATYAAELRAAAGFSPTMGKVHEKRELSAAVHAALDSAHESWNRLLDALPQSPRPFVESLRPVWWVLRAATAWMLVLGGTLRDGSILSLGALLLAVLVSVQLGRGSWGLDRMRSSAFLRVVLLGLNGFAVVVTPAAFASTLPVSSSDGDYGISVPAGGITTDEGEQVTNIYPFDANGQPLTGVQLFDQQGKPINLGEDGFCCPVEGQAVYPWLSNGEAKFNVFPQPMGKGDFDGMRLPDAWTSDTPPSIALPPIESAPKVGLPTDAQPTATAEPTTASKPQPAG